MKIHPVGGGPNRSMQGDVQTSGVRGGVGGFKHPPEIPKAFKNRAKLNPIVKTVKNCWI